MAADSEPRDTPIDAGLGVPSPWDETVSSIDVEGIRGSLRKVATKGLPTTPNAAGPLLNLRSVYARASHPYDPQSRLAALHQLLVRLLADWEGDRGAALRVLYGIASGTRGTSLGHRRSEARGILGYEETYFRQEIEPELVRELAEAVYSDLLGYKRRIRRAAEAEEPTGDTPSLCETDLTHEEELVSRIWQHVYELRAELIAAARLGVDPKLGMAEDHRQAALRAETRLQELIAEYTATYGTELVRHGDAEYNTGALSRLGSWRS
jgi:hypothetical protein